MNCAMASGFEYKDFRYMLLEMKECFSSNYGNKQRRRPVMKDRKSGFTLPELLIVVTIIAVLVAIAIPVFSICFMPSLCPVQRRAFRPES